MSAVETTDHVSEAPEPVDLQSMRALAATPGAGIAD